MVETTLDKILQYFQHSDSDDLKGTIHKLRRLGSAISLCQGKRGMPCKGGGVGKLRELCDVIHERSLKINNSGIIKRRTDKKGGLIDTGCYLF